MKPVRIYDPGLCTNGALYFYIDLLQCHDENNENENSNYQPDDIALQLEDSASTSSYDYKYHKGAHIRHMLNVVSNNKRNKINDNKPMWKRDYFNY